MTSAGLANGVSTTVLNATQSPGSRTQVEPTRAHPGHPQRRSIRSVRLYSLPALSFGSKRRLRIRRPGVRIPPSALHRFGLLGPSGRLNSAYSGSWLSGCPQGVKHKSRWVDVAWLSGGEGASGDRSVAVGPLPGTADDQRAALHGHALHAAQSFGLADRDAGWVRIVCRRPPWRTSRCCCLRRRRARASRIRWGRRAGRRSLMRWWTGCVLAARSKTDPVRSMAGEASGSSRICMTTLSSGVWAEVMTYLSFCWKQK